MDYHNHRFTDYSVMIYKENELYALLPANKVGDKVISHQGLTYGSFVLQDKSKFLFSRDNDCVLTVHTLILLSQHPFVAICFSINNKSCAVLK